MHPASLKLMRYFRRRYCADDWLRSARLLDVGSMAVPTRWRYLGVSPTYRPLFPDVREYVGVDLSPGPGVDVVLTDPYRYPFESASFDVVISGQTLEHTERPWLAVPEMGRVVKPGGLICLIAPWSWKVHRHPVDCWRILADGMQRLLLDGGFRVLECRMQGRDTLGIGTR